MAEALQNFYEEPHRHRGVFVAMASGFTYGLLTFLQKIMVLSLHPVLVIFIYSGLALVFLLPVFLVTRRFPVPDPEERITVAAVAVAQSLNLFLFVSSLSFIPAFDAGVIQDSSPLYSCIFSWLFLQEQAGYLELCFLLLTITGEVVMAISGFMGTGLAHTMSTVYGCLLAIGASILFAVVICLNRKIQATEISTVMWYIYLVSFIGHFIIGMGMQVINLGIKVKEFQYLLSICVLMLIMMFLQIKSVRLEECLPANLAFVVDIPTTFLLQVIFLKTYPGIYESVGAILIILSTILLTFRVYIYQGIAYLRSRCCVGSDDRTHLLSSS